MLTETAPHTDLQHLLQRFESRSPEIVFEWKDSETEAEGWLVINSLRGGAAGGGTRMRKGLDRHEVVSLAKTMEVKFTVSGPAIGGAKSGINFDPADPRKQGVLQRWFRAVFPILKTYYGTGGDLNVDEIHEVIPYTENYGLWHPQEGVVNGHLHPDKPGKIQKLGQLRQGVSKVIEDPRYSPELSRKYKIADMITGWGVAEAVNHYYKLWGGQAQTDLSGKRAIIQGWGNVAAAAAYYLAKSGVAIVGIIDRSGGILAPEGLSFEQVRQLFLDRDVNRLVAPDLLPFETVNEQIWSLGAEIFIPAAASRLVTQEQVLTLKGAGLEVISCGANVPFRDEQIFMGPISAFADSEVAVIPDFVANCGMARVFAYLMGHQVELTDEGIFADTSQIIFKALHHARFTHPEPRHLSATCLKLALEQLV